MESLLEVAPIVLQGVWLVVLVGLVLLLVGCTVGPRITGFGPHVVKEIVSFEYEGEEGRKRARAIAEPEKLSITTETQTHRTLWDWMTILTISAVIGFVAMIIQDQQAKDIALQAYLDQMTPLMLDDKKPLARIGTVLRGGRSGAHADGDGREDAGWTAQQADHDSPEGVDHETVVYRYLV